MYPVLYVCTRYVPADAKRQVLPGADELLVIITIISPQLCRGLRSTYLFYLHISASQRRSLSFHSSLWRKFRYSKVIFLETMDAPMLATTL